MAHPFLVARADVVAGVVRQLLRDGLPWPLPDWDWEAVVELGLLLEAAQQFSGRELIARCRQELLP